MDETIIKRTLPHSVEAENAVIGAILIDPDCVREIGDILHAEDFYDSTLGMYFDCVIDLDNAGVPIDQVTLSDKILEKVGSEKAGDVGKKLMDIVLNTPTSANVKHHATIVAQKALSRRLISSAKDISDKCYRDGEPIEDIISSAEKAIFDIAQNQKTGNVRSTREIFVQTLMNIEAASELHGAVTGIPSGFTNLDYKTAGFQPSELILVAARPSMGKTTFALNLAEHAVLKSNITTAFFSLEMSSESLANRLLSMHSRVESQSMRTGNIDENDWTELVKSANLLGSSKLIIDETPSITISQLRSKCRRWKVERDLKLVIIDYLQLMSAGHKTESRQNEISEISRELKNIAREIKCPVIALSQLSRALESRPDKRPVLSDLRESGAIEQDADVVLCIYRDEVYNPESKDKGTAEIIIRKQRNGPIGSVKLACQLEYTRFSNLLMSESNDSETTE
ncbi:MAG: replicative DNA helicase [Lachnospiraceae bacterium]|nr:replicative DNA helicase [Lachnospiraceae bacterium]